MPINKLRHNFYFTVFLLLIGVTTLSSAVKAQTVGSMQQTQSATDMVAPVYRNDLQCGGFIEYGFSSNYEIVGAQQEESRRVFSQGDYVYINGGKEQGLSVGQEFSIVRPRGMIKGGWTKKKSWLGVFTQEIGHLRVTAVKDRVSVAMIDASCETAMFGDLLRPVKQRTAPERYDTENINRFSDPNGKRDGRILLARGARELVATNDIVYIDLGREDNIKVNDAFTIFRRAGKGTVTHFRDDDVVDVASGGYESFAFKGGKFSNQAYRVKNPNMTGIYGPTTNFPDVKKRRPRVPRKILGELVVTDVQERTATAIITRVAEEIHPGDYIELQ